jgi:hypothetical protein
MIGWMLPSPAWKTLRCGAVALGGRGDARQDVGHRVRGTTPSCVQ